MNRTRTRSACGIPRSALLGLSLVVLSLMLGRPSLAGAATRTVNTLSDTHSNGSGTDGLPALTLREAIQISVGGDTIVFAIVGVVTLANGELAIGRSLTIVGPPGGVVVNGNNTSRVFNIVSGTVSMSNIVISSGLAAGTPGTNGTVANRLPGGPGGPGQGGGILNSATSTLSLSNCWITGNSANGGSGGFASNRASGGDGGSGYGGGIYNLGTLNLKSCTLSDNSANGGDGGNGDTFGVQVTAAPLQAEAFTINTLRGFSQWRTAR